MEDQLFERVQTTLALAGSTTVAEIPTASARQHLVAIKHICTIHQLGKPSQLALL